MAASIEAFLLVEVWLFLLAVVFSCTTIVMRSPTREARLSEYIALEAPSCQSDCEIAESGRTTQAARATNAARLGIINFISQTDQNILFVEHLAVEVAPCKRVTDANDLARSSIFQGFDF